MNHEIPAPDTTVDGTGLLCVTLLLRLRKEIDSTEPGTVVPVIATDPAAPLDLPAWCHMTGHTYSAPSPATHSRCSPFNWLPTRCPPGPTRHGTQQPHGAPRLPRHGQR
jgi:TusA-related sulfurtransferase